MKERIYQLTESELLSLIKDAEFLNCLMDVGVDNWQGYEEACDLFDETTENDDIEAILDNYDFKEVEKP